MTLIVRECLPEDAGAYTCVAENTAGKTSSSTAVCVRGKYELEFNIYMGHKLLKIKVLNMFFKAMP